jgi:hypothetical protein
VVFVNVGKEWKKEWKEWKSAGISANSITTPIPPTGQLDGESPIGVGFTKLLEHLVGNTA